MEQRGGSLQRHPGTGSARLHGRTDRENVERQSASSLGRCREGLAKTAAKTGLTYRTLLASPSARASSVTLTPLGVTLDGNISLSRSSCIAITRLISPSTPLTNSSVVMTRLNWLPIANP